MVGEKSVHLFGRWWQADQIQTGATQQSDLVGRRHRLQVFGLKLREHERVDGIADEGRIFDRRRFGSRDFLKGPMRAVGCVEWIGRTRRLSHKGGKPNHACAQHWPKLLEIWEQQIYERCLPPHPSPLPWGEGEPLSSPPPTRSAYMFQERNSASPSPLARLSK